MEARIQSQAQYILRNKGLRDIFAPNGIPLREGDTIYRLNYSITLETIATHGADAFYKV